MLWTPFILFLFAALTPLIVRVTRGAAGWFLAAVPAALVVVFAGYLPIAPGESVREARQRFPELRVRLGIELEYRPEWTDTFDRLTGEVPFDFVLGSVHIVDGCNISGGPHRDLFFVGRTQDEAYGQYFRELDAMVEWGGFDVVSHFDLITRFGHRHFGPYEPARYRDVIQPVLEKMVSRGLGLEINTSGVAGPGAPYPERDILVWAREAGVPALTIGTDSHRPDAFADGLVEGVRLAQDAGWNEFTLYEGREPAGALSIEEAAAWAACPGRPG